MTRAGSLTIPELLSARAAQQPDQTALVVDGVGSLTFAGWDRRSDSVARGLMERGVRRGDRVGLLFSERDWIDFAVAWCGVHKAGGVTIPLSERLAPSVPREVLADCSAVLHGPGSWSSRRGDAGAAPDGAWHAAVRDLARGDGISTRSGARPDDLAEILYSPGTTGTGATHASLTFACQPHEYDPRRRKLAHSRHFLHAFPVGSKAGQMMLITALDARPTAVTLPGFTPGRFARLIESYRPGTVYLVPAMAIELLNADEHQRHDLSCVLLLGSTAASLPPPLAARLAAMFPNATIVNYCTSTEAAPAQTVIAVSQ